MVIVKEALTYFASIGKCTLRLPKYCLCTFDHPIYYEEIPDEWVEYLQWDIRYPIVSSAGVPFLTREGYRENRERLRLAFNTKSTLGFDWDYFDKEAVRHFVKRDSAIAAYEKLQEKRNANRNQSAR